MGRLRSPLRSPAFPRLAASLALSCALSSTALLGTAAHAQGIASNAEAPREGEEIKGNTRVAVINEIERGIYVSLDYGLNYYVAINQKDFVPLGQDFGKLDFAQLVPPGTHMGMRVGFDVLNNLQVEGFVLANFNQGNIDPALLEDDLLTGDLAHFVPGVAVRFDFITVPTEHSRFFAYVRAGAGYAVWFPGELIDKKHPPLGSIHTEAALGIEYYTSLRHLSVGFEVQGQALLVPFAFGIAAYPTLKYTFGNPFSSEEESTTSAGSTPAQ